MSNHSWKRIILGIIFLFLSIFYAVLFYQRANFGETMIFNIAHLKSLGNIFTSPINFNYWNHSGSQINLFSPWLTILSGWIFVNINVPYGFTIYLAIITFLTFVSAYYFMNKFSKNTLESLLFSVIYTFSLNRFNLVFQNQRLENYLVLIFLPMIYFGAYQLFNNRDWHILTWGLVLAIWTAPYIALAVVITLVPMFFAMIFKRTSHHWQYWGMLCLNIVKLMSITLITTVGYWGPLVKQSSNKMVQDPIKNVDYFKWFDQFNFSQLQRYLLLSIVILLGLLLIIIFLKSKFSYKILLLETLPLTAAILFPIKLQFADASRLVFAFQIILELFLIIIVSRIAILICQEMPSILKLLLVAIATIGFSSLVYSQSTQLHAPKTIAMANAKYEKFVVDYHDKATNGKNQFLVNGQKTSVSFYTKANDYWIQYYNPKSVILDLPIQKYSGYKIQLNNENVKTSISKRGTIQLRTHPGKSIVEIHTQYNWLGIGSLLLNLLGIMYLVYLSIKDLSWKKKKIPKNS